MIKLLLIVLLPAVILFAQLSQSSGNLLHVDINSDTVNIADSLGSWVNGIDDHYSAYKDVIRMDDSLYFIRSERYMPEYLSGYYLLTLDNSVSGRSRRLVYFSAIDVIPLYDIPRNVYKIPGGNWIFDDVFGSWFLSKDDSLYTSNYLYNISGKVDSLYFVIWYEYYEPSFYLLNLDASPFVDISHAKTLNFNYEDQPVQVEHFKDDLYFIQTSSSLKLYTFQADSFKYVKTVLSKDYMNIYFNDNSLYAYEQTKLIKHNFISADTTFSEGEILLSGDIYVDRNYKYAVKTDSVNLILYDVVSEAILETWDISHLGRCFNPLIDYPDIYFHHTVNTTAVADKEPLPKNYLLLKAYPNPFNSSVVFNVNNTTGNDADIKVFDIRGRLVRQFDASEIRNKNRIIWQPQHLSSGIYFVRIKSGTKNHQLKICYLK